ncbi:MAG TPA: glycine betaine ABC transporter substrate-binding protein [Thermoleophilaceae bacterium]|jgi:glycine betaine/choline ABC-type transport system substrate-binding protein
MRRNLLAVLVLVSLTAFAACGSDDNGDSNKGESSSGTKLAAIKNDPANKGKSVTIGSKNFTEEFILGNIYAQALKAAGYTVKTQFNLGSEQIAHKALQKGQIDAYPEYTSTALTSFFNVKIADAPKTASGSYAAAKKGWAKEGFTALAPTPFNDAQAVGMTKKEASSLGVKTISDLKPKESQIVFAGSPECKQRVDCLLGLQQTYKLKFKKFVPVDIAQRYKTADDGQAQLIEVFTTDGQLATGKYVVLVDDKHLFPPYNATLVVNSKKLSSLGPGVRTVVNQVQKGMTTRVMQELNSRVDIDKQEPKDVASEYLKETGLVR